MARITPDEAATELALALRMLVRKLRSAAPSESHELSWTQKAVMLRLDTEGPATTAELARAEGVKPQSMGAALAVLEEMELVERRPHPTDGRQMIVALTTKGQTIRNDTRVAKRSWLADAISKLDVEEQRQVPMVTALIKRLGEL